MKLYKALKLRKKLVGEIAKLKEQIKSKNSYIRGSVNPEKYSVNETYKELSEKTDELIALKCAINDANRNIQEKIFQISELKSLLNFWNEVSVSEGTQPISTYSDKVQEYDVQIDELERNKIVAQFQSEIDALQEEIDVYNYTKEISWCENDSDDILVPSNY